jgi:HPt (histidine-containing phosphotransfer) domain-containing protein
VPDRLGTGPIDPDALDELLVATGDDRAAVLDLIDTFLADGRAILASMGRAAAAGAEGELQRPAHALKASANNFGAWRLVELSRQLEADSRGGTVGDAAERVAEIEREFSAVEAALLGERPGS